jgi:hypothetical protein
MLRAISGSARWEHSERKKTRSFPELRMILRI